MAKRKKTETDETSIRASTAEAEPEAASVTVAETKTETVAAESETAAADASAAENQTVYMYVGASLPGIKANTIISGEIPEILDVPFVRELLIPVDEFTKYVKRKSVTDSREAFCFRKSAEYAKTLKK